MVNDEHKPPSIQADEVSMFLRPKQEIAAANMFKHS